MHPFNVRSNRSRPRTKLSPRLESLEGRQLMSLGSELSGTLNTTTRNAQFASAVASSSNGNSVAVWTDTFSNTDHDIRAQRMNAVGGKTGSEIVVSASGLDEGQPAAAMDSHGNFVVTWMQTLTSGDTNVVAERFNSAGVQQGPIVQVGVGTFKEHDPSVAMDAVGNFTVAYTRNTNNNNPDIFAKQYNSTGQLLNVISVATSPTAEDNCSIAMAPDGRFDVAWETTFSVNDHDIYLKQYSPTGTLLTTQTINNDTANETLPSVSMDNSGNAVVAYQRTNAGNADIFARRVSSTGILGTNIPIAATSFAEQNPSVALKRTGGEYVVVFDSTVASTHVNVAEVSSTDKVKIFDAGQRFNAAVSINGFDNYIVTYTSNDAGDLNIRRRVGHL
jgi:hypothetical protein